MIKTKTKEEIEKLREGGKILAKILAETKKFIKIGTSTYDINEYAHGLMIENKCKPAFLDYTPDGAMRPFPASLCVCLNDEIVHGIPNENPREIQDGDLVTIDAGLIFEDLFTDSAISFVVGESKNPDVKRLLAKTEEALYLGIKQAQIGNHIGDIGHAIQRVADAENFSIVDRLAGHGVGYAVHEEPYVPNYGEKGEGIIIKEGLVIAIEPMFSLGSEEIKLSHDGYTFRMRDGAMCAQFEHTIAVTKKGPIILTSI